MKILNELQQELDEIRKRIDPDDKFCIPFEIEPSKGEIDHELKIQDNRYHVLKYERGKKAGAMVFENEEELAYYFTMAGIGSIVNRSELGIGRMTADRLGQINAAKLKLMKQTKPEWVPRFREYLEKELAKTLSNRENLRNLKSTK